MHLPRPTALFRRWSAAGLIYRFGLPLAGLACLAFAAAAQYEISEHRTAREALPSNSGFPEWSVDRPFKKDVFTFVRIQYSSEPRRRSRYGYGGYGYYRGDRRYLIDYPDSDLNFSFRLQQMTSLKVDPDCLILKITDKDLFNYPWIYIVEPGYLVFSDEEVKILRRYLLNGGFLMVDDFWGEDEWANFYEQIKRVFPNREPVELPLDHPIFHCVIPLKEKPQIPNINLGIESQWSHVTWERPDAKEVHIKGIYDDKGRLMVVICHNTDLGDGWEQEGVSEYYFHEFSEKKAYPLGINIVFYAMTH